MSNASALPRSPEALAFLLRRRSHPPGNLTGPAPDRATLRDILTAGARVPDHGKLEPWRFVVAEGAAMARLGALAEATAKRLEIDPEKARKGVAAFAESPMVIAVIAVPRVSDKVPEWEQKMSAGAACLGLVNAALAAGYGASWLTGWAAADAGFARDALTCAPGEWIAGLIFIGTPKGPSPERPRPDLDALVTYL